jgi:hypothetical protein
MKINTRTIPAYLITSHSAHHPEVLGKNNASTLVLNLLPAETHQISKRCSSQSVKDFAYESNTGAGLFPAKLFKEIRPHKKTRNRSINLFICFIILLINSKEYSLSKEVINNSCYNCDDCIKS